MWFVDKKDLVVTSPLKIHPLLLSWPNNRIFGNKSNVNELHFLVLWNPEHEGLVGFELKLLPDDIPVDVERQLAEVGLLHIRLT